MQPPGDMRAFLDALLEAINARDFDALPDLLVPEFEFISLLAAAEGETYVGIDGIRAWAEGIDATWDDHRVEFTDFRQTGPEQAVLVTRNMGTAKLSGVPLDSLRGMVVTRRDGRVCRAVVYADPADAFQAAGLPE